MQDISRFVESIQQFQLHISKKDAGYNPASMLNVKIKYNSQVSQSVNTFSQNYSLQL